AHAPPPVHVPAVPSHCSPESMTLSPQPGAAQIVRQVFGVVFELPAPASHSSAPPAGPLVQPTALHVTPSPHVASLQVLRQRSVSVVFPSSHSSTPERTKPSPHAALLQSLRHASALLVLPSSHCSAVALRKPSPQTFALQSLRQASSFVLLPSSHASELLGSFTPSPQNGDTQVVRHASGVVSELASPSSHSSPSSTLPLPQVDSWQPAAQVVPF